MVSSSFSVDPTLWTLWIHTFRHDPCMGDPGVAPFFADLDPSAATGDGGVYVRLAGNKIVITWSKVPPHCQSSSVRLG